MSDTSKEKITSVDELPEDPLAMPPPFWRGGGAILHVLDSLRDLCGLLPELIEVHERTQPRIAAFLEKYPEDTDDLVQLVAFSDICDDLWELENRIKLRCERAILMSAIEAEDDINMFCVFNLPRDVAESIEQLSPAKKLLIAAAVVKKQKVKSNTAFEAIGKLVAWRNAFAHGHCVDRPVKSLRHNHLIRPHAQPGVPDTLAATHRYVSYYVKVAEYLRSISINPYTAKSSTEIDDTDEYLGDIGRYHFDGDNHAYTITCEGLPG